MPLSILTDLLVKCKGKQDHIFYPCPIIPIVQSAAQILSQRLLLYQRADSCKERDGKIWEGNKYLLCFCPFGPSDVLTSQNHSFLCQSKSSKGRLDLTPTAEEPTSHFSGDTTPSLCWLGHLEELVPKAMNLCHGWSSSADLELSLQALCRLKQTAPYYQGIPQNYWVQGQCFFF